MKHFGRSVGRLLLFAAVLGLLIGGCGVLGIGNEATAQSISLPLPNYAMGSNGGGGISDVQNFAQWAAISANSVTSGSNSVTTGNCYFPLNGNSQGPQQWFPFAIGVQVKVIDPQGSNSETVYITGVSQPALANGSAFASGFSCGFTANFANAHTAGFKMYSGDGGVGEAAAYYQNASSNQGYIVNTPNSGVTVANLEGITSANAIALFSGKPLGVLDESGSYPQFYALQPTALTQISAPTTTANVTCNGIVNFCQGATTGGTWTNAAYYFAITYIDPLGGESVGSTTANFTFGTSGTGVLSVLSPPATAGAVGYRVYGGTSYNAAYQLPITSATCTLSTQFTLYPVCAIGAAGTFLGPVTTGQLVPQSGGVAAGANPNPMSHTTFGLRPVAQWFGFQQDYGPFTASGALTGSQKVTLATVQLPVGFLNLIGRAVSIDYGITLTPSTGGTVQMLTSIGDLTDNSSGAPKTVCTDGETTATGTAAIKLFVHCVWTVNAVGATGSIMPDGFIMEQLQAGTTTGNLGVEQATGAVTADVLDQDAINVVFTQATAAESTTPPQITDLHIRVLPY